MSRPSLDAAPAYEFTIPGNPQGINQMWRKGWHGGVHLTHEAQAFKTLVAGQAMQAGARGWGDYHQSAWRIEITNFHRYPLKRLDVDAPIKLVLDGLIGVLYKDDWQVKSVSAEVIQDAKNPRVVVKAIEVNGMANGSRRIREKLGAVDAYEEMSVDG